MVLLILRELVNDELKVEVADTDSVVVAVLLAELLSLLLNEDEKVVEGERLPDKVSVVVNDIEALVLSVADIVLETEIDAVVL